MSEHLVTSIDGSPLVLRIPYLCDNLCENGHFLAYPASRGFDFDAAGLLIIREDLCQALTSLLQEWLYFGLLQEFLGSPINSLSFVRPCGTSNQRVLDSSSLRLVLPNCRQRLLDMSKIEREQLCKTLASFIRIAITQCRYIDQDWKWSRRHHLPEILLSIRFLLDSLIIIIAEFDVSIDSSTKDDRYPLSSNSNSDPPSASILVDHMLCNGWCWHHARLFCTRFTYNVIYYLASFRRKSNARGHEACRREDHCVANDLDASSYRCQHVEDACTCEFMTTPTMEVGNIIRRGGIPVLSFSKLPSGEFRQKVIRAKYSTNYTAISHIWSDGLGNPSDNSLPKCQLERLASQVQANIAARKKKIAESRFQEYEDSAGSNRSVNIWMDTLCIPVNDESLKIKAINRMSPTYKRATSVLVLDSGLAAAAPPITRGPTSVANVMDTCAQLTMAAWNTRSWTLQEGALAQTLDLPIQDCNPARCGRASGEALYIHLELHKAHQLPEVGRWKAIDSRSIRECQFIAVWNKLSGRTTTQTKDLHGIFANLLDFHAEEITALCPTQRMKAILCAQERLPLKLLYNTDTRRVAEKPLDRWIPDIPRGSFISDSDPWMEVTAKGLLIKSYETMGKTIVFQHELRTSPFDKYHLKIEGLGMVEIITQRSLMHAYPPTTFNTTVLYIDSEPLNALKRGLSATGVSFAFVRRDQEAMWVTYQDPILLKLCKYVTHDARIQLCVPLTGLLQLTSQSILIDIGISYRSRHGKSL